VFPEHKFSTTPLDFTLADYRTNSTPPVAYLCDKGHGERDDASY